MENRHVTKSELEEFHRHLEATERCRFWSWPNPQIHYPFLAAWPPGYLAALAHWQSLPWRVRQLLAVEEHGRLEPGLVIWRGELGFELAFLFQSGYTEPEFRQLARVAVPSMAFLRGLLWRADPELAASPHFAALLGLLADRGRGAEARGAG